MTIEIQVKADSRNAKANLQELKDLARNINDTPIDIKTKNLPSDYVSKLRQSLGIDKPLEARVQVSKDSLNQLNARRTLDVDTKNAQANINTLVERNNALKRSSRETSEAIKTDMGGMAAELNGVFQNLAATMAVVFGASAFTRMSDDITRINGTMRVLNYTTQESLQTISALNRTALESRTSLNSINDLYYKLALAQESYNSSGYSLVDVVGLIGKTAAASRAPIATIDAAMFQFTQSMRSGVFRGEELNSVLEGMPDLAEAIAKGMGKSMSDIRAAAQSGLLTTAAVLPAIAKSADFVNARSKAMGITYEAALNNMGTATGLVGKALITSLSGTGKSFADHLYDLSLAIGRFAERMPDHILNMKVKMFLFGRAIIEPLEPVLDRLNLWFGAVRSNFSFDFIKPADSIITALAKISNVTLKPIELDFLNSDNIPFMEKAMVSLGMVGARVGNLMSSTFSKARDVVSGFFKNSNNPSASNAPSLGEYINPKKILFPDNSDEDSFIGRIGKLLKDDSDSFTCKASKSIVGMIVDYLSGEISNKFNDVVSTVRNFFTIKNDNALSAPSLDSGSSGLLDEIRNKVSTLYSQAKTYIGLDKRAVSPRDVDNDISNAASKPWNIIKTKITSVFDTINDYIVNLWKKFSETFPNASRALTNGVDKVKEVFGNVTSFLGPATRGPQRNRPPGERDFGHDSLNNLFDQKTILKMLLGTATVFGTAIYFAFSNPFLAAGLGATMAIGFGKLINHTVMPQTIWDLAGDISLFISKTIAHASETIFDKGFLRIDLFDKNSIATMLGAIAAGMLLFKSGREMLAGGAKNVMMGPTNLGRLASDRFASDSVGSVMRSVQTRLDGNVERQTRIQADAASSLQNLARSQAGGQVIGQHMARQIMEGRAVLAGANANLVNTATAANRRLEEFNRTIGPNIRMQQSGIERMTTIKAQMDARVSEGASAFRNSIVNTGSMIGGVVGMATGLSLGKEIADGMTGSSNWEKVAVILGAGITMQALGSGLASAILGVVVGSIGLLFNPIILGLALMSAAVWNLYTKGDESFTMSILRRVNVFVEGLAAEFKTSFFDKIPLWWNEVKAAINAQLNFSLLPTSSVQSVAATAKARNEWKEKAIPERMDAADELRNAAKLTKDPSALQPFVDHHDLMILKERVAETTYRAAKQNERAVSLEAVPQSFKTPSSLSDLTSWTGITKLLSRRNDPMETNALLSEMKQTEEAIKTTYETVDNATDITSDSYKQALLLLTSLTKLKESQIKTYAELVKIGRSPATAEINPPLGHSVSGTVGGLPTTLNAPSPEATSGEQAVNQDLPTVKAQIADHIKELLANNPGLKTSHDVPAGISGQANYELNTVFIRDVMEAKSIKEAMFTYTVALHEIAGHIKEATTVYGYKPTDPLEDNRRRLMSFDTNRASGGQLMREVVANKAAITDARVNKPLVEDDAMRLMRASLEHIVARGEKIEPSFKGYEAVLEAVRVAGGQNLKENGDVTLKAIKSIGEPARTVNVKDFIGTADTKLLADAVILNMDKHGEWTKAYPREPITAVATNNKVETTIAAIKEAVSPTKVAAPDDLVSALNTQAKEILAKKGENSLLEGIGAYIKKLESSNKYNIRYNGRDEGSTFEGTEHPNIKVKIPGADGLTSTAAGAHQWLYTTWVDISKKMGTDVKDFSKEAQDKAFAFYVKELDKNGDLAKGNVSELFQKLTSTWPSLASGRSSIQKAASTISETSGVPLTDKVKEVFATVKDSTINGATAVGAGGSALLTGLKKAGSDLMGSIQPALDAYKKNGSISELASAIGEIIMKGIKSGLNSMSESFGIMKDTYTSLQSKNTPEDFARNLQSRFGRYFGPLAENVNATNLGNLGANAPQVYGTLDAMDKQTTILEQMRADGLKDSTAFKNATLALQQMGEQVASSMVRRQQEPPKVNRIAEIGNRISTTNMNNPDAVRAAIESANDALQGIATITDVAQLKKFAEGWDDVVGLLTNISELKKVKPGTFGFETSAKLRRESEDRVLANPALVGITNVRTPKYTPSEMAKSAGEKISGDVRGSMQQNLGDLLKGKTNIGDTIFAMNNTLQDSVKDILAGRLTKMFEESDANKTLKGWGEQLGGGKTPAEIEDQNRKHAWEVQVAAMPDGPEKDAATGVTQANRALDGGTYKGSGDTAGAYYDPITNAVMPLKEGAEAFKQWVDGMIAGTGKKGYDSVDPKTGKMIDAPTVSTDPATAADAIVTPLDSLNSTSSDGNSINMRGFKSVGKIMSGLSDISQMGFSNMIQTMLLQSAFGGGGGGSLMGNLIGGAVKAFSGGMDGAPAIQGMGGGAYAEGGAVVGAGTGTSDSIAALVSNGEFIVNAKSTRDNFSLLQAINNGRLPRFAVGGIVGSSIDSSTLAMPRSISQGNTSNSSTSVFNINVSGDVSRQTRSEIQRMIPQIASGVNMHNYEKGRR